ncbi:MAG TPA: hypothetical protein PLT45_10020 [Smithella sp.]|nr:hypothetical protein [Smithella sp.]
MACFANPRPAAVYNLRGPQKMFCCWPSPGSGPDEEGYMRTGDVVRVDENGCLSVVDRTRDVIIVSGFQVYPMEVDDVAKIVRIIESLPLTEVQKVDKKTLHRMAEKEVFLS